MFISRDPIGLMGGDNVFQYAPNPTGWIDPLGLSSDYRVSIMINDNTPVIGTHAGLILNKLNEQIIWDPSGSFVYRGTPPYYDDTGGSNAEFWTDNPDHARSMWRQYMQYQYRDGPNVSWYTFSLTEEEYNDIYERIDNRCGGFAKCSFCVSSSISGIGPFENIESGIRTPKALGRVIEPLFYKSRE